MFVTSCLLLADMPHLALFRLVLMLLLCRADAAFMVCLLLGASSPLIGGGEKALRSGPAEAPPFAMQGLRPKKNSLDGAPSPKANFFWVPSLHSNRKPKSAGPFPPDFGLLWRAPSLSLPSARAPCCPPGLHSGALKRNLFSGSARV